jgi:hypothetical protein
LAAILHKTVSQRPGFWFVRLGILHEQPHPRDRFLPGIQEKQSSVTLIVQQGLQADFPLTVELRVAFILQGGNVQVMRRVRQEMLSFAD